MERRWLLHRSLRPQVSPPPTVYRLQRLICPPFRFERELEALRKELAEVNARSERSSPTLGPQSDDDISTLAGSPKALSPIVTAVDPPDNVPPINSNGSATTPTEAR